VKRALMGGILATAPGVARQAVAGAGAPARV
jgi:hypothetical protein